MGKYTPTTSSGNHDGITPTFFTMGVGSSTPNGEYPTATVRQEYSNGGQYGEEESEGDDR